jgi:cytochrome c peroxidase
MRLPRPVLGLVAVSFLGLISCKTVETPPPAPPPKAAELAPSPPPPEPLVELSPAPPLPAAPLGAPEGSTPASNPLTAEKAELGWKLFFDPRLSKDGTQSCESCHHIARAYTSGAALDAKVGGAMNKRNAPQVLNLGSHPSFYWDGRAPTLEAVSAAAWKGQLGADPAASAQALNEVKGYKALFVRAFGEPATKENVPQALASFFRALKSGNSAWDRAQAGDKKALSREAQEGYKVFTAKGCVACHVPPLFSDLDFHNVGLGDDPGRKDATKADADLGRFKTPSLRNVALTAPYFHDGQTATLEAAISFMARGGVRNPNLDPKLKPQKVSAREARALKAFLESLTGESTYGAAPSLP